MTTIEYTYAYIVVFNFMELFSSGKERDEETGFSYFGARHYNSLTSTWLSVDPLSDKYPNRSPYVYCANNPVRLVDVDGMEITDPPKAFKQAVQGFKNTLNELDVKVKGTAGNYEWEGHSDGANRGTITQQDVIVGTAVIATVVTVGAALEAETIGAGLSSIPSIASSADDMTTDASGQTASQRVTGNNLAARTAVNVAKTSSSIISVASSSKTIAKRGIDEASACLLDMANSAYNSAKSLVTTVNDFIKSNDNKNKKTKE